MVGSGPRSRPVGNKLRANDPDSAGSVDPQPDLPALEPDDRDANVITDEEFFHDFPGQNQHVWLPSQYAPGALPAHVSVHRSIRFARPRQKGLKRSLVHV